MDTDPNANHDALTETRIAHVVAMMERLEFVRSETVERLAKEWGLSESGVRNITSIASKRVRARVMDPDLVNSEVGTALREALQRGVEDKDTKSIVAVAKVWAEISGATAPQKLEHSGEGRLVIVLPPDDDGTD